MEKQMTNKKEKTDKKRIIIGLLVALTVSAIVLLAVFYVWKMNYYKSHFLPNTTVNGADCSEWDALAAAQMLETEAAKYELTVSGRDEKGEKVKLGVLTAEEIEFGLIGTKEAAEDLLAEQDAGKWLFYVLKKESQSFNVVSGVEFDEAAVKKCMTSWDAFQEENMTEPADAYISEYKEELNGCEIIPEVMGTQIDIEAALEAVNAVISGGGTTVDLAEQNCYAAPAVTASDEKLTADLELLNKWLGTEITYDWNTFEVVVDGSLIQEWIIREEDGDITLDEKAVSAFVAENATQYDTYGKRQKFTTTLGVEVSLTRGGFGWKTNRSEVTEKLVAMIKEGAVTKAKPVYSNTAPQQGMNDIGSSYVEADLSNQHLYLYYKGQLVFETDFVSGTMSGTADCVTPAGIFDITYKQSPAVLRGADYVQPVSYWMPFYGNYGMHDATWRSQFGGDIFMTDGSHGCLNLPLDSAAVIYNYMYTGYPVVCYYY